MKKKADSSTDAAGFTLLEIIATILVGSVLAAMMVQFMSTAMTRGGDTTAAVRTEADTDAVLEKIISEYVQEINTNPATALANLKTNYAADADVTMAYVSFDGTGQEMAEATPTDALKVTVQGGGYSAAALLTNTRVKAGDPVSKY